MRSFLIFCLVIGVLIFLPTNFTDQACAQSASSSCVVTKVGDNAGPQPTLPAFCNRGGGNCMNPPDYPSDLRQAIIEKFKITFNNFDQERLKWFWEELWNTSGTHFSDLASGAIVEGNFCPGGGNFSCMVGCDAGATHIYFGNYPGEEFNKVLIVHELGHYIMGCKDQVSVVKLPSFDDAHATERGITPYGRDAQACAGSTGVSNRNEDYAETITYYLHPFAQSQSIACALGAPNPFYNTDGTRNSNYPMHYIYAQMVLGDFACRATTPVASPPI